MVEPKRLYDRLVCSHLYFAQTSHGSRLRLVDGVVLVVALPGACRRYLSFPSDVGRDQSLDDLQRETTCSENQRPEQGGSRSLKTSFCRQRVDKKV